jgi:hypothetical protein
VVTIPHRRHAFCQVVIQHAICLYLSSMLATAMLGIPWRSDFRRSHRRAAAYLTGLLYGAQRPTLLNGQQVGAVGRFAARPYYATDRQSRTQLVPERLAAVHPAAPTRRRKQAEFGWHGANRSALRDARSPGSSHLVRAYSKVFKHPSAARGSSAGAAEAHRHCVKEYRECFSIRAKSYCRSRLHRSGSCIGRLCMSELVRHLPAGG